MFVCGRAIRPAGFRRRPSTLLDASFAFAHYRWPMMAFVHARRHPHQPIPAPPMRRFLFGCKPTILSSLCALLACGGAATSTPTTGTLRFTVATTGTDIPPDGYSIAVDGGASQAVPANGTLTWIGAGGSHTLAITGLAFNCDFTTAPASATITLGQVTSVAVEA